MNKPSVWVTTMLLLVYVVFISGLFYWVSGSNETNKLITPFSWALSAKEQGLTPIATKGDMDCVHWLVDSMHKDVVVIADSNGVYMLMGWTEYPTGASYDDSMGHLKMRPPYSATSQAACYIFMTDWNVRNSKYTYCTDVGLRKHLPYGIEETVNGGLLLYGINYSVDGSQSMVIREVYKSGNSVIYEKVR